MHLKNKRTLLLVLKEKEREKKENVVRRTTIPTSVREQGTIYFFLAN